MCYNSLCPNVVQLLLSKLVLNKATACNELTRSENEIPIETRASDMSRIVPLNERCGTEATPKVYGFQTDFVLGEDMVSMAERRRSRHAQIIYPRTGFHYVDQLLDIH